MATPTKNKIQDLLRSMKERSCRKVCTGLHGSGGQTQEEDHYTWTLQNPSRHVSHSLSHTHAHLATWHHKSFSKLGNNGLRFTGNKKEILKQLHTYKHNLTSSTCFDFVNCFLPHAKPPTVKAVDGMRRPNRFHDRRLVNSLHTRSLCAYKSEFWCDNTTMKWKDFNPQKPLNE